MNAQSPTILYIEDDEANRMLVRKLLKSQGFKILEAENGVKGIDLAIEANPDLILMDMNMPELNGYEAATRIKSIDALKHTPIIALTANVMSGDRQRSLIAGCNGYITKPIDAQSFVADIQQYLGGRKEKVAPEETEAFHKEYTSKLVERLETKVRELNIALDDAQESNRVKTEFLSIMSHELLTPMNAIMGFTQLLLMQEPKTLDTELTDYVNHIDKSSKHLLAMIKNMLNYSAMEAGDFRLSISALTVHDVVQHAMLDAAPKAQQKSLLLHNPVQDPSLLVLGDPDKLNLVLTILLDNATKFTDHGEIAITSNFVKDSASLPEQVRQAAKVGKKYVRLSIADTGIGIDEKCLPKVFDLFYQCDSGRDRHFEGTGIGLATAKRLIELHDGFIWVESGLGKGSTFHVLLPCPE